MREYDKFLIYEADYQAKAKSLGLDPKGLSVVELQALISEHEESKSDYEAPAPGWRDPSHNTKVKHGKVPQPANEPKEAAPPKASFVISDPAPVQQVKEEIIIQYVGLAGTYQVGPYAFTQKDPFLGVPVDIAKGLLENHNFKESSPEELLEYYKN